MSDLDYESPNLRWCPEHPYGGRPEWAEEADRSWHRYDLFNQPAPRQISPQHARDLLPMLGWFQYLAAFSGFAGAIYLFDRYANPFLWPDALGFLMVAGLGPAMAISLLLQACKAGCRSVIRGEEWGYPFAAALPHPEGHYPHYPVALIAVPPRCARPAGYLRSCAGW